MNKQGLIIALAAAFLFALSKLKSCHSKDKVEMVSTYRLQPLFPYVQRMWNNMKSTAPDLSKIRYRGDCMV